MDRLDFKLNYYFNKLKDLPFQSRNEFKGNFIRKYGKFELLNELMLKIENYQIEKYEQIICLFIPSRTKIEKEKIRRAEYQRKYNRKMRKRGD
jgi:hypothetical protein